MRERLVLALDKSVRRIDQDGHLHVETANISKAMVNPYRGTEIPDWERLGLDPNRIYKLFRDPEELRKGAGSFSGKPLLSIHKALTATDHAHRLTVGSIGDVSFDGTYLHAPLTVWDADAIAGIDDDEQRELSSGYRYDADMTPGTFRGERYDGVMRNIRGNHVALVSSGRAGSDVVVGDAALILRPGRDPLAPASTALIVKGPPKMKLSRAALLASGALRVYLTPKLATDAKIDLAPLLKDVAAKTWKRDKPRLKAALEAAIKGKLAQDADIADVTQMLDSLDDATGELADEPGEPRTLEADPLVEDADDDAANRLREFLTGKVSDEDLQAVLTMLKPEVDPAQASAQDAPPPFVAEANKDKDKDKEKPVPITKAAMDAAMRAVAAKTARETETSVIARMNAIREAERLVRPLIGELAIAQDSAEDVFKLALDSAEIELEGVPVAAYGPMVRMLIKQRKEIEARPAPRPRLAHDAKEDAELVKRFPGLNSLKHQ